MKDAILDILKILNLLIIYTITCKNIYSGIDIENPMLNRHHL